MNQLKTDSTQMKLDLIIRKNGAKDPKEESYESVCGPFTSALMILPIYPAIVGRTFAEMAFYYMV